MPKTMDFYLPKTMENSLPLTYVFLQIFFILKIGRFLYIVHLYSSDIFNVAYSKVLTPAGSGI